MPMPFRIQWMAAVYDIVDHRTGELRTHIGVPEVGRHYLLQMLDDLQLRNGQVALYLPESTRSEYEPGGKRGKVIAVARARRIPPRQSVEDYAYPELDGSQKWPIGFPCEIICAPDEGDCPSLRELAEACPEGFRRFAKQLHDGPIELNETMQTALNFHFDSVQSEWAREQ